MAASRKPAPGPLRLQDTEVEDLHSPSSTTVISPRSPRSPFRSFATKKSGDVDSQPMQEADQQLLQYQRQAPSSQTAPAPSQHAAAPVPDRQERPAKGGFFSNYKAAKSSGRSGAGENSKTVPAVEGNMSRDTDRPSIPGEVSSGESKNDPGAETSKSIARRPVGGPSRSEASLASSADNTTTSGSNSGAPKKNKANPFSLIGRTRSQRGEKDEQSPRETSSNSNNGSINNNNTTNNKKSEPERERSNTLPALRPAPATNTNIDRSYRKEMGSNVRQRSEDRVPTVAKEVREQRENGRSQQSISAPSGHTLFTNGKSFGNKVAGALSKGLFGKSERSNSTTKKDPPVDDEHYEIKVMNLPLVEQTRLTRISKRLEDSRDKTEFWMPAFPWRAIDYLNYKGSDVEGLYRVPGSGPQIKKWQRRFDEELDIDLFEQDDLYDINIIGSMLKAWMRELPDELFPKASQDKIARECSGAQEVPQLLIDELSNLSPFNYYLLFAITCHLSLLLAHSDKNKMDFRNLCICFQPCMKIDAFCFNFLVNHWRDCWKGCKTEAAYTEQEYQLFEPDPPSTAEGRSSVAVESHDERNVSSSDSSKPSSVSVDQGSSANPTQGPQTGGQKSSKKKLPLNQSTGSNGGNGSGETVNTTLTIVKDATPPRRSADMRPLSPIKPLSPIGF